LGGELPDQGVEGDNRTFKPSLWFHIVNRKKNISEGWTNMVNNDDDDNGAMMLLIFLINLWGNSIYIATGCGLEVQGSIPVIGKVFFCIPQSADRLWSSPSLLHYQ
jgi:hypothetical protein